MRAEVPVLQEALAPPWTSVRIEWLNDVWGAAGKGTAALAVVARLLALGEVPRLHLHSFSLSTAKARNEDPLRVLSNEFTKIKMNSNDLNLCSQ